MQKSILLSLILIFTASAGTVQAGIFSKGVRETSEWILKKFGKGAAGETVDQVARETAELVAKNGDNTLPFLRKTGHNGIKVLKEAGEQGPDIIRLYARKGDEAVWLVSKPDKLAIFLKHGDSAADALMKHPGIADDLIRKFGDDASGTLVKMNRSQAQKLARLNADAVIPSGPQGREMLKTIRKYGDEGMDFIWKNKGALAVTAVLASFLNDPEAYITGTQKLITEPIIGSINWNFMLPLLLIIAGAFFFGPGMLRKLVFHREKPQQES